MELKTAIEILEYHQEWRLGKRQDMIHEPKKLTEALDTVLSAVKKLPISDVSDLFIDEEVNQAARDYAAVDDDNVKKGSYNIREKQAFIAGVLYVIKRANNR